MGESSPEAKGHIMLGSKGRNEKQINQKLVKKKINSDINIRPNRI